MTGEEAPKAKELALETASCRSWDGWSLDRNERRRPWNRLDQPSATPERQCSAVRFRVSWRPHRAETWCYPHTAYGSCLWFATLVCTVSYGMNARVIPGQKCSAFCDTHLTLPLGGPRYQDEEMRFPVGLPARNRIFLHIHSPLCSDGLGADGR
jgi:hypothetical protein